MKHFEVGRTRIPGPRSGTAARWLIAIAIAIAAVAILAGLLWQGGSSTRIPDPESGTTRDLPVPSRDGILSLEEALATRRSVRDYAGEPLTDEQIGQLLWAAQGVTDAEGRRTAPSAGMLYPLEIHLVTRTGVFRYVPASHSLVGTRDGDMRRDLQAAAWGQSAVGTAPAVIVVSGVYERTAAKYGSERATRYVQLEAGHAAQNVLLQAVALRLGAVPIGAFDDRSVQAVLNLPADCQPLYLIPVGHPA